MTLCARCAERLYDHPEALEWSVTEYSLLHIRYDTCGECGLRFKWGMIQFHDPETYEPVTEPVDVNRRMLGYRIRSRVYRLLEIVKLWLRRRR